MPHALDSLPPALDSLPHAFGAIDALALSPKDMGMALLAIRRTGLVLCRTRW